MSRFVPPDVRVLKISQGDSITVKRRLNAGEQRAAFAQMATPTAEGSLRVNPLEMGIAMVLAYLVDWTLTDNGKLVVIRDQPPDVVRSALNALDPDSFTEIKDAIDAHDVEIRAERERLKNSPDGGTESPATSPSLVAVAGDMSGSVN